MSDSTVFDIGVPATPFGISCPTPGCKNRRLRFVTGITEDGAATAWADCRVCKEPRCAFGHRFVPVWRRGISSYNAEPHDIKVCAAPGGCQRRLDEMDEAGEEFKYRNRGRRSGELLAVWKERARGTQNWRDIQAETMVRVWQFWSTRSVPKPRPTYVTVSQTSAKTSSSQAVAPALTVEELLAAAEQVTPGRVEANTVPSGPVLSPEELAAPGGLSDAEFLAFADGLDIPAEARVKLDVLDGEWRRAISEELVRQQLWVAQRLPADLA